MPQRPESATPASQRSDARRRSRAVDARRRRSRSAARGRARRPSGSRRRGGSAAMRRRMSSRSLSFARSLSSALAVRLAVARACGRASAPAGASRPKPWLLLRRARRRGVPDSRQLSAAGGRPSVESRQSFQKQCLTAENPVPISAGPTAVPRCGGGAASGLRDDVEPPSCWRRGQGGFGRFWFAAWPGGIRV